VLPAGPSTPLPARRSKKNHPTGRWAVPTINCRPDSRPTARIQPPGLTASEPIPRMAIWAFAQFVAEAEAGHAQRQPIHIGYPGLPPRCLQSVRSTGNGRFSCAFDSLRPAVTMISCNPPALSEAATDCASTPGDSQMAETKQPSVCRPIHLGTPFQAKRVVSATRRHWFCDYTNAGFARKAFLAISPIARRGLCLFCYFSPPATTICN